MIDGMNGDLLSQEEIDALLNNGAKSIKEDFNGTEIDVVGEIGNISMGSSATALGMLLGKKVRITTPKVEITTMAELRSKYPIPFVSIEVEYTKGLEGVNLLIVKESDAKIISDLMMGGTGKEVTGELDEMRLSAVGEAMNQMMGTAATSMSTFLQTDINIAPPKVELLDLAKGAINDSISHEGSFVMVGFQLIVENLIKSEIMQLMPLGFAKRLVEEVSKPKTNTNTNTIVTETNEILKEESALQKQAETVEVKPVIFDSLDNDSDLNFDKHNIDLILDVPLEITVELGRTVKLIKDILNMGRGSIIELDKLAGEPVDILVNGKMLAKGEVVVIDENFGIRVTDIKSPKERINNLQ
jgi:flagellar motor switch protein FliN/FliY